MDAFAQTILQVVIGILVVLLAVRLLLAIPPLARRVRRPEGRTIRVAGVGGGGSNAVDHMIRSGTGGVEFIAVNTDAQALRESSASRRIRIGSDLTRGLGAGGNPEIGRRAAEEDLERIREAVAGADLVFITAGLGGGTGSGAGPIVAQAAKEQGALTVGVVTKPFTFEGTRRRDVAEAAGAELLGKVDALITIPNDRVAAAVKHDASLLDAFAVVDDVLRQGVQGLIDMVSMPGLINLDFADVRAIMEDAGPTLMGLGRAAGENRAVEAARQAMTSPLLEARIDGANGILFDIAGSSSLRLAEVQQAAETIRAAADPDANVIFGASFDDTLGDEVRLTLIATGLPSVKRLDEADIAVAWAAVSAAGVAPAVAERALAERALAPSPVEEAPPEPEESAPVVKEPAPVAEKPSRATEAASEAEESAAPDDTPDTEATREDEEDLEIPSFIRRRRVAGTGSRRS